MTAKTSRLSLLVAVLTLVATGCPTPSPSGSDGGSDAGNPVDAGTDAGNPVDAGTDAGNPTDAGSACVSSDIEVTGLWQDDFGDTDIAVNGTLWWEDTIVSYDNAARTAVLQTYASAPMDADPGTYYVNYWTAPQGGSFYYCTASFDQPTVAAALANVVVPDASNPSQSGCSGFSWTQLSPWTHLDIDGSWQDGVGDKVTITDVSWNTYSIVFNGTAGLGADGGTPDIEWAVTKNPPPMGSDTSTYNRVVWLAPSSGTFYSCLESTGLATAEAAEAVEDTVDSSSPSTGGCNGSAWLQLTAVVSGG